MRKAIFILGLIVAVLVGCTNKTYLSECTFDAQTQILSKDGNAFSGIVNSDDGKFAQIEVKEGTVVGMKYYHDNGKIAHLFVQHKPEVYYDDKGNVIKDYDYKKQYPEIVKKEDALAEEFKKIVKE